MSSVREKRREEGKANNHDGLVEVQQPDGTRKHITREEWGALESGDENGAEE